MGVICMFSIRDGGWTHSKCVFVCVYASKHTHCTWETEIDPRGRDETLEEPEESRCTQLQDTFICTCV